MIIVGGMLKINFLETFPKVAKLCKMKEYNKKMWGKPIYGFPQAPPLKAAKIFSSEIRHIIYQWMRNLKLNNFLYYKVDVNLSSVRIPHPLIWYFQACFTPRWCQIKACVLVELTLCSENNRRISDKNTHNDVH